MRLWQTEQNDNGVVTATYEFPPMNYIGSEGSRELGALIDAWKDPAVRVVVITGGVAGKFVTHFYGEEFAALGDHIEACRTLGESPIRYYNDTLMRLQKLNKPVIAAINGDAMGGGYELSLACDIRIAQRGDFRIGLPETLLGLIPGGGGTQRLPRMIGTGRAVEFILRGRIVTPDEALAIGLVTHVTDDALGRAQKIARQLAALPPMGLARAKLAVYRGSETSLDVGLEVENSAFADTLNSEDTALTVGQYLALAPEKRRDWLENPSHPVYGRR